MKSGMKKYILAILLSACALLASCHLGCAAMATPEQLAQIEKDAERGDAEAQCLLGILYEDGNGVRQDYRKAKEWYKKAAEQGHAKAQYFLGGLYYFARGVQQDYHKAKEWYEKAAEQENAGAQFALGVLYENGHGVRQEYATAKEWYGKACDNGDQDGCDAYKRLNTRR